MEKMENKKLKKQIEKDPKSFSSKEGISYLI